MSLSNKQARAARALLGLDQSDVSAGTGIHVNQISKFEKGAAGLSTKNMNIYALFFQVRGVEFIAYDGVRMRPGIENQEYKGAEEFRLFFDDIYSAVKEGGKISIFNGVPSHLIKWLGQDWYDMHARRMRKVSTLEVKVLIEHGECNLIGQGFAEYKWFPKDKFHKDTIYVYADKTAFINFDDEVRVLVIKHQDIADFQRVLFDIVWGSAFAQELPPDVY